MRSKFYTRTGKNNPYNKILQRRRNIKNKIIQDKIDTKLKNEHYDKCPICHSRLDGISRVPIYFIEEKIQEFIECLKINKKYIKKLEKEKYIFLEKLAKI